MKSMINRILFLILISFTSNILLAQITFKVSDVVIATDTIEEVPYRDALEARIGAKIESFDCSKKDSTLIPTYAHSFVAALHHCFADHRPMVISPDMIWLMICQGLAQHIELKSDSLREKLVDFEGKKRIVFRNDNLIKGEVNNNWAGEFPKFAYRIKKHVKTDLYDLICTNYSTTTHTESLAYQITLMKAVDTYFEYTMTTICGIPQITLEGTVKDWEEILHKTRKLDEYGLKFWTIRLIPILEEFVNASNGNINRAFWQSIYKWNNECGEDVVNGWIKVFFPYVFVEKGLLNKNKFSSFGITPESIPNGLAIVDLNWIYQKYFFMPVQLFQMELYSGFLGVEQNLKTKALKPKIEWAIRDKKSDSVEVKTKVFVKKRVFNMGNYVNKEEFDTIFEEPQIMPVFFLGDVVLKKWIASKIIYPEIARLIGVEGRVYVRFCISKKGAVSNVSIERGVLPLLDNEALRVVSSLPKWKPGMDNGNIVNTWYTVPVDFRLNKN